MVCTIDSVFKKCWNFQLEKYTLFLDEFNSIVEYMLDASNVQNRIGVVKFLVSMLRRAKQVICVDADISDLCFTLLQFCGKDFTFVANEYKHNSGVRCTELFDYEALLGSIRAESGRWFVCCDSKTEAKKVWLDLNKDESILLLTSETKMPNEFSLDDWDKIIYSPTVIYGLDGQLERKIFCLYKEHTISPKQMLQQVCRCRNITSVEYFFNRKAFQNAKFNTINHVSQRMGVLEKYSIKQFQFLCGEYQQVLGESVWGGANDEGALVEVERIRRQQPQKTLVSLYKEMLVQYTYKKDCYDTNKFVHFKTLLQERGFVDDRVQNKTNKIDDKKHKASVIQDALQNFDFNSSRVQDVNSILKLCQEEVESSDELKMLFVDEQALRQHFSVCRVFFRELIDIQIKSLKKREFLVKKISSENSKIEFLRQMWQECGVSVDDDSNEIACAKGYEVGEGKKRFEEYRVRYSQHRNQDKSLSTPHECSKLIASMLKQVCGSKVCTTKLKRTTISKSNYESKRVSMLNVELKQWHEDLFNKRHAHALEDEEELGDMDVVAESSDDEGEGEEEREAAIVLTCVIKMYLTQKTTHSPRSRNRVMRVVHGG